MLEVTSFGCVFQQFSDAWLLDMSTSIWTWTELTVVNPDLAVQQLWCHPACHVRSVCWFCPCVETAATATDGSR